MSTNHDEPAPFYGELDEARRTKPQSCCTLWTLALGLVAILIIGLAVIFM
jgi:hypothetical protein